MQPLHDLPVHPVPVRLPELRRGPPVPVRLGHLLRRLSPESTSSTTCAFNFGVYRRRAMPTSFRSASSYPEQHRARRSNVTKGRCPASPGHIPLLDEHLPVNGRTT